MFTIRPDCQEKDVKDRNVDDSYPSMQNKFNTKVTGDEIDQPAVKTWWVSMVSRVNRSTTNNGIV